jgi:hypothetical protein
MARRATSRTFEEEEEEGVERADDGLDCAFLDYGLLG